MNRLLEKIGDKIETLFVVGCITVVLLFLIQRGAEYQERRVELGIVGTQLTDVYITR